VLRPRSWKAVISLTFGEVDLNPTSVEEGALVEFLGSLCLIFGLEAYEAELSAPLVLKHNLSVGHASTMTAKVSCQVNLFEVLGQVFDDQSTHRCFLFQ